MSDHSDSMAMTAGTGPWPAFDAGPGSGFAVDLTAAATGEVGRLLGELVTLDPAVIRHVGEQCAEEAITEKDRRMVAYLRHLAVACYELSRAASFVEAATAERSEVPR